MKKVTGCKIADMLRAQKKLHISFHTPGHKRAGADITELSYSDNLYSPHGVIAEAEKDVAELLGAAKSYLLTDGSTCGVFAMIAALKGAGVKKIAASEYSHVSVKNACDVMGIEIVPVVQSSQRGIMQQPTAEDIADALEHADALLLTSPDYYGNIAPLHAAKGICKHYQKPFVVDGAHGSHLRFESGYAGRTADMWVDGVHKSLPALTQGAVVSANAEWAERLGESVRLFRTTSPSYPILASVEYAVKYPHNAEIAAAAQFMKAPLDAYLNDDWSKIVIPFGEYAYDAQRYLERKGVYPEFNDGNYLMFYVSPCTKLRELKRLYKLLKDLPRGEIAEDGAQRAEVGGEIEWIPVTEAVGRTCAKNCGIFPPCIPLVKEGDKLTEKAAARLSRAENTFGLREGEIAVFREI